MISPLILLAPAALLAQHAVAAAVSTNSTTLQIPLFGYGDSWTFSASIIGVTSEVTTLSLACSTYPSEDCYAHPTEILTIGPSTYHHVFGDSGDGVQGGHYTGTQDCFMMGGLHTITSTSFTTGAAPSPTAVLRVINAVCQESLSAATSSGVLTNTVTYGARQPGVFLDVVVTAGAEMMTAPEALATAVGVSMKAAAITATTGPMASRTTATSAVGGPTHTGQAGKLGVELALGAVAAGAVGLFAM
jgi:hypothetical protein